MVLVLCQKLEMSALNSRLSTAIKLLFYGNLGDTTSGGHLAKTMDNCILSFILVRYFKRKKETYFFRNTATQASGGLPSGIVAV